MLRLIRNRKRMAALLLVMLLGAGVIAGFRWLGNGSGDSGWTTVNAELSEVLERNGGESTAGKNSQTQGAQSDRQKTGAGATPSSGTTKPKQTGGVPENREDKSKDESGVHSSPGKEGQAQGQEQSVTVEGTAARGNVREGGNDSGSQQAGNPSGNSSDKQDGNLSGTGKYQQEGDPSGGKPGSEPSRGLIDLNTASVSRLTDLPGIGESKARAIVEYRKQSGGFHSREELMKVKGIGQKTFDKLKELITVSP